MTSPDTAARLATSVKVTRWLADIGFPTVEPLSVDQPVIADGYAVTFWRYLPQEGPAPGPPISGGCSASCTRWIAPPVPLPVYRPLVSVRQAIESSHAIDEDERAWLRNRCDELLAAYDRLSFPLPAGMIHGDAWRGNLLRDGPRVVLADWDEVSTGPREIDLVPTLQGTRFGLSEPERDAFIAAYGHDIRGWDGYPVLREIRELSTITRTSARRQRKRGCSAGAAGQAPLDPHRQRPAVDTLLMRQQPDQIPRRMSWLHAKRDANAAG